MPVLIMLYYCLKILHIISATLMLTSIIYSYRLWKNIQHHHEAAETAQRIQTQTWLFIIPFALIQLGTGFTMISVQHYDFSEWWISGSVIGFIVVIGSWFSFVYFLLLSQQFSEIKSSAHDNHFISGSGTNKKYKIFRQVQSVMLMLCAAALLSMIFFMANKSASLYG
jgi:uncharacterized membrane protein